MGLALCWLECEWKASTGAESGDTMSKYAVEFLDHVRVVMFDGGYTDRYIEVGVAGVPYLTDSGAENMKISHEYKDEDDTSPEEVVDFHLMEGMVEVLSYRGAFFHGDRVREVAQEWLDAGFFPCKAGEWMDAGVWDSGVARTLKQMGESPKDLGKVSDDLIYSWCNGDKSVVWPSDMEG